MERLRALTLLLVVGCGGGASVTAEPGTQITASSCSRAGGNTVAVEAQYNAELDVGQAWESAVLVGISDIKTNETQAFNCGAWTMTGSGASARGCQRDRLDQPESLTILHTYGAAYPNAVPPGTSVTIIANVFESPGGISIGGSDSEDVQCF
jgi:hypothetical protein